ncbi:hypothetical protein ACWN8P_11155 [Vagococcus salmoninarum]|uniref:Alternate signal-mediated exported protein n=1 Tax=Vagococcus salmoninarum TaxID=2739 RepID=A0A429ZGE4_9ENTE|nr:hypothetical protein [Vagococcus salmoninarum]RST92788.1 hypothetical protein CBF35_12765 [Vagococcus salmoninarum]
MKKGTDKKTNKRKKVMAVAASASLCALMLGTFAWDVYKAEKENKFGNALVGGSIEIEEIFEDPHMTPGKELKKQVKLVNTSSSDVFARASFEESMKILQNAGPNDPNKKHVTSLDATTLLPTTNDKAIPIVLDVGYYVKQAAANTDPTVGWADITATTKADGAVLDAGVQVFAKLNVQTITSSTGDKEYKVTGEYVAYRAFDIANSNMGEISKNIVVKLPGTTDKVALSAGPATKEQFKINFDKHTGTISGYDMIDFGYDFYDGLKPAEEHNWAGDVALFGLVGDTHPAVKDTSAVDPLITLGYNASVEAAPTPNKWVYNAEDGYFYFLKVLTPEDQTDEFLATVALDASAGTEYAYLDYSLHIEGQAVLVNKAAVEAEFGLTSASLGTSKLIYDALIALVP